MKGFLIGTFLVLLLLPCLFSCRYHVGERLITIYNNSDATIGIEEVWSENIVSIPPVYQNWDVVVPIYPDSFRVFESRDYLGWYVDFKLIPFIRFLVMDYEICETYDDDSVELIRKNVPVYHCFDLTLEDVEAMNYKIVYPPKTTE